MLHFFRNYLLTRAPKYFTLSSARALSKLGESDSPPTPANTPNYTDPGPTDYLSIWLTDQDEDGSPWGLEQAIGTDPAVADSENSLNISTPFINPTGAVTFLFGHNPDALAGTTLSLTRSQSWAREEFTTLFSSAFDGIFQISEFGDQANFTNGDTSIDFLDDSPPSLKAFYRLEATYNP